MFHRVKSELPQNEEAEVQQEELVEDTTAEVEEQSQPEEAQVEAETETLTEEAAETSSEISSPVQNVYQRNNVQAQNYSTKPAQSYTSPQPTTNYAASIPDAAPSTATGDSRLAIGPGITMSGEIEHCDELYVEGTVEAALKGANELNIAESGVFYGTVEIQNATISGRFEGELLVRGRLTVEETGVITGTIAYKEISIEAGAVIDGRITPLSQQQQAAQPAPQAQRAPTFKAPKQKSEPSNEGLFSASKVEAAE